MAPRGRNVFAPIEKRHEKHFQMIEIVPYDPCWPSLFESEAALIRREFGPLALRIEHVGSTAVPGLDAKPVIDIQISVASLDPIEPYAKLLGQLGYGHVPLGDFDLVYPFFQKPSAWPSTHHVHLCSPGNDLEMRHIAFRDYLRTNPEVAREYARLKRELATENNGTTLESRERYSLSKSRFVNSVLELSSRGNGC